MARFQKGHNIGHRGGQPGTGRKPNWWKHWCEKAIKSEKRLKRIEKILDHGEDMEFWEVDRYLSEVAFGKPTQSLDVKGEMTINLSEVIKANRAKRGLTE